MRQVQHRRGVVGHDEGEDGVLHEVVGGAAGDFVELDQVFEIGDFPLDPERLEFGDVGFDAPPHAPVGQIHLLNGREKGISVARRLQSQQKSSAVRQEYFHRTVFQGVPSGSMEIWMVVVVG